MDIRFGSADLRRACTCGVTAARRWGHATAALVRRGLDELHASRDLQVYLGLPHVRYRRAASELLVHLAADARLVLGIGDGWLTQSRVPPKTIQEVTVLRIEDRHATAFKK